MVGPSAAVAARTGVGRNGVGDPIGRIRTPESTDEPGLPVGPRDRVRTREGVGMKVTVTSA